MLSSRLLAVSVLPALVACADGPGAPTAPTPGQDPAPLYLATQGGGIPGQYIVVLKENTEPQTVMAAARVTAQRVYRGVLTGFAARLTTAQVEAIRRESGVEYVEQDQLSKASVTRNIPAGGAWGLDRIDQRTGRSGTYTYTNTGAGVNVYVLDTGIESNHPEFAGAGGSRASAVYDAFGGTGADCHGHGTHVAGTIGGVNVGVANGVALYGLRVLDCAGSGSNSGIIAALDWLRVNRVRPAVANMSLGGGYSKALNVATDRLYGSGVFVVVAAGNDAAYSCDVSPASAVFAFTVAATDSLDARAGFSNWGRCVSLYAPGVFILSSYLNSQYAYASGTSMAAPHVAGLAALYYQQNPTITLSVMRNRVLDLHTTPNAVKANDSGNIMYGTPNKLLYTNGL